MSTQKTKKDPSRQSLGGYFIEFYIMEVLRSSPRNAGLQRRTKILCEKQVVYN